MPAPKPRVRCLAGSAPAALSGAALLAASGQRHPAYEPLRIPRPAPGVLPQSRADMAMDDAGCADLYGYAHLNTAYGVLFPYADRPQFLGFPALSELAQIPEYRRMVGTLAQEMTRKWIRLTSSGEADNKDRIKLLGDALERFRVRDVFREAWEHDGYFGRGQIYIDVGVTNDPDELKSPLVLTPRKIARGALRGLRTIEPIWSYPAFYNSNDPMRADFYKPQTWYVMGKEIHYSRLVTVISREVPDMLKPAYMFAGVSLTQLAKRYVENWTRTQQSVADLLESFTYWVLETDLQALSQSGDAMVSRFEAFSRTMKNRSLAVVDKNTEGVSNVSAPLSGLHELQAQAQEHQASVDGFPLVKLLGITPSGLNASSEGELKCWYDRVHAQQEHFNAQIKRILDVVQLSEFGDIDPDIGFNWEPLWEPTAAELATIRKTEADTAVVYINAGVISPDEERQRVAREDGSAYTGLDLNAEIEAPGQEDAPQDGAEGQASGGGAAQDLIGATDKAPAQDAEFHEEDHPRAPDGRFGSGGAATAR